MTARIIALCNQKGGVGKTTTAFHLTRAAVVRGLRVLVVDADPQGNLTSVTTAEQLEDDMPGLADALSERVPDTLQEVIAGGVWPGVDVVPTTGTTLGLVRDELVLAGAGRESRLRTALAEVADDYDLVLIDCAPSLDQLTINALTAADAAVVVTESKLFSSTGLSQLLTAVADVRRHYNPALSVGGVLVNKHEAATVSGRTWIEQLHAAAGTRDLPVLDPPIPRRVVISDATEAATGLDQWSGDGAAALAAIYDSHLSAILERITR